jgi:hypothetical protein
MPFDPFTQTASIAGNSNEAQVDNLADVLSWIENDGSDLKTDTRLDYSRAIKSVGKRLRKPLSAIQASTDAFRTEVPDAEYSVRWGKSFKAFRRWKGKVCAAIKGAKGLVAAKAERRARDDDWQALIVVVSDITARTPPDEAIFHENEIIGVRALADAARCADVPGPRYIPGREHDILAAAEDPGQRKAIIDALHLCDHIRSLRDNRLGHSLPDEPIAFSPTDAAQLEIPDHLIAELDVWLDVATRGRWSSTKGAYGKGIARKPYQDATRKVIHTAHRCDEIDRLWWSPRYGSRRVEVSNRNGVILLRVTQCLVVQMLMRSADAQHPAPRRSVRVRAHGWAHPR